MKLFIKRIDFVDTNGEQNATNNNMDSYPDSRVALVRN